MSAPHGMEAFFTREKANEGIELPLYLPSGGKSEHSLRIRGVDSDIFRLAEAEAKRDAVRILQLEDKTSQAAMIDEAQMKLLAVLVISWSFPQECAIDNVVAFFRQAPQIADAVNQIAGKRALFFAEGSSS